MTRNELEKKLAEHNKGGNRSITREEFERRIAEYPLLEKVWKHNQKLEKMGDSQFVEKEFFASLRETLDLMGELNSVDKDERKKMVDEFFASLKSEEKK